MLAEDRHYLLCQRHCYTQGITKGDVAVAVVLVLVVAFEITSVSSCKEVIDLVLQLILICSLLHGSLQLLRELRQSRWRDLLRNVLGSDMNSMFEAAVSYISERVWRKCCPTHFTRLCSCLMRMTVPGSIVCPNLRTVVSMFDALSAVTQPA
jgi:hypothetical protein